jgi:hypothetical protein
MRSFKTARANICTCVYIVGTHPPAAVLAVEVFGREPGTLRLPQDETECRFVPITRGLQQCGRLRGAVGPGAGGAWRQGAPPVTFSVVNSLGRDRRCSDHRTTCSCHHLSTSSSVIQLAIVRQSAAEERRNTRTTS